MEYKMFMKKKINLEGFKGLVIKVNKKT